MADRILTKPQVGERLNIQSAGGTRLQFDFPTGDAVMEKSGNDLVFTFTDGSSIVLGEFYTAYTKESMPEFVVEGQTIAGTDFFAALGADSLMPAAGPAAAVANSNRFRTYDESTLMGGIDRLNGLDITGEGSAQPVDTLIAGTAFVPTVGAAGLGAVAGGPISPVEPGGEVPPQPEPPVNGVPTLEDTEARADYGDTSISGTLEGFDAGTDGLGSITIGDSTATRGEDGSWSFDDPAHGSVGEDGSLNFTPGGGTSVRLDPDTGDYTISNPGGLKDSSLDISIKDGNGDTTEGKITVETPTVSNEQNSNANDVIIKGEDSYTNDVIASDSGGTTTIIKGGDYNIAICLDVSGSMSASSGYDVNGDGIVSANPDPSKADCPDSRLDMALASLKSMVAGFEGHQGTINIAIFPFGTYGETPIYLTIKPGDDIDKIMEDFIKQLDKIPRYPANDFDGSTNPEHAADAAGKWLKGQEGDGKDVVYILTDGQPSDEDKANAAFDELKKQNPDADINGIGYGEANGTGMDCLNRWGTKEGIFIKSPDELQGALEDGLPTEGKLGAGSDLVVGGAGQDVIFGDTAIDYAGLQGLSAVQKYIADQLGVDVSTLTPEAAYLYIKGHPEEFDQSHLKGTDDKGNSIDLDKADMLIGGSGHDIIYGQGGDDVLLGDGGIDSAAQLAQKLGTDFDRSPDALAGSIKGIADAIHSMDRAELSDFAKWTESHMENTKTDGNDTMFGGSGDDILFGGAGNDKLFGGEGDDVIFGGSGNDYINGGAGADTIFAGSGDDMIVYDAADPLIDGGQGFDALLGGAGDLDAMRDGLVDGKITGVELLISGKGSEDYAGLTDMDDLLNKLGITKGDDGELDMAGSGFNAGREVIGSDGQTYYEYTNGEDLTIIIAKGALENSGA